MGENIHFSNGNGNGTTQFFFNGQDMSGMGIDPSQLFSMFFSNGGGGHDDFGFGSSFGGMRGGMRGESGQGNNNAGSSNFSNFDFQGFPGFGFGNMGGFGRKKKGNTKS